MPFPGENVEFQLTGSDPTDRSNIPGKYLAVFSVLLNGSPYKGSGELRLKETADANRYLPIRAGDEFVVGSADGVSLSLANDTLSGGDTLTVISRAYDNVENVPGLENRKIDSGGDVTIDNISQVEPVGNSIKDVDGLTPALDPGSGTAAYQIYTPTGGLSGAPVAPVYVAGSDSVNPIPVASDESGSPVVVAGDSSGAPVNVDVVSTTTNRTGTRISNKKNNTTISSNARKAVFTGKGKNYTEIKQVAAKLDVSNISTSSVTLEVIAESGTIPLAFDTVYVDGQTTESLMVQNITSYNDSIDVIIKNDGGNDVTADVGIMFYEE